MHRSEDLLLGKFLLYVFDLEQAILFQVDPPILLNDLLERLVGARGQGLGAASVEAGQASLTVEGLPV